MIILVILLILFIIYIILHKELFEIVFPEVIKPTFESSDIELNYCKNSIVSIDEDIDLNQTLFDYRPKRIVYSKSNSSNSF